MNKSFSLVPCLALVLLPALAPAATTAETDRIRQLEERLQQLQQEFEQTLAAQRRQIQELQKELATLRQTLAAPAIPATFPPPNAAPVPDTPTTEPTQTDRAPTAPGPTWTGWPLRIGTGTAYVDIGLVGTFAVGTSTARDLEGDLQPGGHDPNQRGFTVQGVELNFTGAVDPYFLGSANLLYARDADGESHFELEEAWLQTLQLPAGLQLRAGQIYAPFGRFNGQHLHQWAFVDSPLAMARLLGPDGLRNPGARLSWLMPTTFYSELFLAVQNSRGDGAAAFRGGHGHTHEPPHQLPLGFRPADNDRGVSAPNDLLWTARYAVSTDLTLHQTVLLGLSAALGPNASGATGEPHTQIYGVDLYWKWKSPRAHAGFPFVSLQTEALLRRYELGAFDWDEVKDVGQPYLAEPVTGQPAFLPAETVTDYGFYTELLYGFRRGWVAGLRFDYVAGRKADYEKTAWTYEDEPLEHDPLRARRWRLSPNLTWYPSEYSRFRLQYNYDRRRQIGEDHSIWLQWELSLGAHAAHQF